jgi:hypothetical protein
MESQGGPLILLLREASPDDGVVAWRQFLGNRNTISTVRRILFVAQKGLVSLIQRMR